MLFPTTARRFSTASRLLAACLTALWAAAGTHAQELAPQPTPYTTVLDFALLRRSLDPQSAKPIWLESVQVIPAEMPAAPAESGTAPLGLPEPAQPPHTLFRIRLRSLPGLGDKLLLRLFFLDHANARPKVTAWSETGACRFASEPLGAGLELPVSESLVLPTQGTDYVEIDTPGDGFNVRKAFLTTLKSATFSAALDFAPAAAKPPLLDPFGNPETQQQPANDTYLFGRVRATLEAGVIQLAPSSPSAPVTGTTVQSGTAAPQSAVSFAFDLESPPLLACVALDLLNADPLAPLQSWANDQPLGPVAPSYPDLADPAYTGLAGPLEPMRFRYAGWLHAQVIIPGTALKAGSNTITLQLPAGAGPVALRAVELQLKHNWKGLDYTLAPSQ